MAEIRAMSEIRAITVYTAFTYLVSLFKSADKIDGDDAFVHLILPPNFCHVSARIFCSLGHPTCAGLEVLPPPPPPPAHLRGGERGPLTWSRVWLARGGGETGVKPPHAGWPRIQKILAFVSLFYEAEIGFIDKITS